MYRYARDEIWQVVCRGKKIKSSIAFILRKALCLTYVKVFNIYHLLCVGIALSSACKLKLTQKLVGGLVRGFYP